MKAFKLCVALLMVVAVTAAASGCSNRNGNVNSVNPSVNAEEPLVGNAPNPDLDLNSRTDNDLNDRDESNNILDKAEDRLEDALDPDDNLRSGLNDNDADDRLRSGLNDNDADDRLRSGVDNNVTAAERSATTVMSTDFSEIGALSTEKLGWGSGGPTDDAGRPNGATSYQNKYGKYGAYFIAPSSQKVYLTFDEGYENGFTPKILDTLKEKGVSAVFFITMDYAKSQPELVRRMVNEGHVLGNHSIKHLSFPDMELTDAANDIMKLHEYVKSNFGYEMSLFRPPMGEFSEQTLALAQTLGYKTVFWSFAYQDYLVDNQPLTIEALEKITSKCHPGAVYLLHAVSKTNAEILGEAIDVIRQQGFTFSKWDIY